MEDIPSFSVEPASLPGTGALRKRWHGVHKALADPLRIRILEWLAEAPPVGAAAGRLRRTAG